MAETQKINKLIIETGGVEYELDGGGGGGQPGPNTVGTEQIIDGAVQMEDLNDDLKDKISRVYNQDEESMSMEYNNKGMEYGNTEQNDDPASLLS